MAEVFKGPWCKKTFDDFFGDEGYIDKHGDCWFDLKCLRDWWDLGKSTPERVRVLASLSPFRGAAEVCPTWTRSHKVSITKWVQVDENGSPRRVDCSDAMGKWLVDKFFFNKNSNLWFLIEYEV